MGIQAGGKILHWALIFSRAWAFAFCFLAFPAFAVEVGLAGLFSGKVLLTINGGPPRVLALGSTSEEGVKVLSIAGDTATLEVNGQKRVLRVGQNVASQPSGSRSGAVLTADAAGHFVTTGSINGKTVRFLVDTGASAVSLGAGEARRMGLDTSKAQVAMSNTANGTVKVLILKLDSVRVGEIVLNNVDATVLPQDMPFVLLGMSFLNRMEMQRSGATMTLQQRY